MFHLLAYWSHCGAWNSPSPWTKSVQPLIKEKPAMRLCIHCTLHRNTRWRIYLFNRSILWSILNCTFISVTLLLKNSTMEASKLCSICQHINFKELMFQPQDDYNSLQTESGDVSLPLGNIEDLYARAKHCEVCALIVDSAERINEGVTIPPVCKNSPVECTLKQSYLGLMTNAIYRVRSNIDVRVNRLRIRFDPEPFGSHLFAPAVTL